MNNRIFIPLGIFVAILYWFMDSLIHWFGYGEERFEYIPSDFNELWMRILICILFICIGIVADYFSRKLLEKEKEKKQIYKATANEALHILKEFLHEVRYFESEAERIGGFDYNSMMLLETALKSTEHKLDRLLDISDITAGNIRSTVRK